MTKSWETPQPASDQLKAFAARPIASELEIAASDFEKNPTEENWKALGAARERSR